MRKLLASAAVGAALIGSALLSATVASADNRDWTIAPADKEWTTVPADRDLSVQGVCRAVTCMTHN